jgi:hypothetical protein
MKSPVAFCGRKKSGKSTMAAYLVSKGYTELSLAAELKTLAVMLFPSVLTPARVNATSDAKDAVFTPAERRASANNSLAATTSIRHDPDVRAVLTKLFSGAEKPPTNYEMSDRFARVFANVERSLASPRTILQVLGTEWGRSLWEEVWLNSVRRTIVDKPGLYVIPDARFPNELTYLKQRLGASCYWLEAETRLGPNKDEHASEPKREALIGQCDGEIDTNGPVGDSYAQVERLILAT